jgi:uncharacterized NAD-dependent epimerase/dehydratase family protein
MMTEAARAINRFEALDPPTRGSSKLIEIPRPYALFLGSADEPGWAKTALGLYDWVPEHCVAEVALAGCQVSTGLPRVTVREAWSLGARSFVIGVAPVGGRVDPLWIPTIVEAIEAGLDIVSGMHTRLASVPEFKAAAERSGRQLIDVRRPPENIPIGTGRKRSGLRLLTMGSDCALGKKYCALSLTRAFRARGVDADFRATGQTGIMIAGSGIPMDAVVSDFIAGAAELLSPDAPANHWDVIEGQGSLFHPAYAAVTLGLLDGSQPDVLVICHDTRRSDILGCPGYVVPRISELIELALRLACRVNPKVRCAGISLNTGGMSLEESENVITNTAREYAVPVADPIRGGPAFESLVDACLNG